jgi:predicted protein tyrosine phosphatase
VTLPRPGLGVQVLGQLELEALLEAGGPHYDHLISIGNPRQIFRARTPDQAVPALFRQRFRRILRLSFFDVDSRRHLAAWQFPRKVPSRSDVRAVIRFYRRTCGDATGYTLHCWQGVSRSPAFALGILYMLTGSESRAREELARIRPDAGPHQGIVRMFDAELGCRLVQENERLRKERLDAWKRELDLLDGVDIEEINGGEVGGGVDGQA